MEVLDLFLSDIERDAFSSRIFPLSSVLPSRYLELFIWYTVSIQQTRCGCSCHPFCAYVSFS